MKDIEITQGLTLPITGEPIREIRPGAPVSQVAVIADDSIGLKPTMEVSVGDSVKTGQLLFTDKKNPGVRYTSPGSGTISAIHRGAKRHFLSLVIDLDGDETLPLMGHPGLKPEKYSAREIRNTLVHSGLWPIFRTRPYGKVPAIDSSPTSLFITAMDSEPLSADPAVVINNYSEDYGSGLKLLRTLLDVPIHYCSDTRELLECEQLDDIEYWNFSGPHPAGLPSTHIHFIDPVHEHKTVWHIGYQDIISIGYLFRTGHLMTERIVALSGPGVKSPTLISTRQGANLQELCRNEVIDDTLRIVSGSVLSGRKADEQVGFLGRFHNQITVLPDSSGRSFFNWALPGSKRFSVKPVFSSTLNRFLKIPMNTAVWGGKRAIYPLGTYEDVMPLDIIPTYLLKALAVGDTEKAKELGCLELVEEDLALCGFACPGKNEFGEDLRNVLTTIELEG